MTRDDIIRMAKEAGFTTDSSDVCPSGANVWIDDGYYVKELERFAELVAAAEREDCAFVAEEQTAAWTELEYNRACMDCAAAIRRRSNQ